MASGHNAMESKLYWLNHQPVIGLANLLAKSLERYSNKIFFLYLTNILIARTR